MSDREMTPEVRELRIRTAHAMLFGAPDIESAYTALDAYRAAILATECNAKPTGYYSIGPDNEFDEHKTEAEAKKAAGDALQYIGEDEFHEGDFEQVSYGELRELGHGSTVNIRHKDAPGTSDEDNDRMCSMGWDYMAGWELVETKKGATEDCVSCIELQIADGFARRGKNPAKDVPCVRDNYRGGRCFAHHHKHLRDNPEAAAKEVEAEVAERWARIDARIGTVT